jgi:type I restriction-modification system DNA methylase subunit
VIQQGSRPINKRRGGFALKLIHLSDLHLGKRVNEFPMIEDQKYILEEICTDGNKPTIKTYGQELNEQSYAIAKGEALITNNDAANIRLGNTLSDDQFPTDKFNFIMANPPYGATWKKDQAYINTESMNPDGRFYAGLPLLV